MTEILNLICNTLAIFLTCFIFWAVANVYMGLGEFFFGDSVFGGFMFIAFCAGYGVYHSITEKGDDDGGS